MTFEQVEEIIPALSGSPGAYLSIFAGRIADTGRDPIPLMRQVAHHIRDFSEVEVIWASTRELLNVIQARQSGCQIITVPANIINKIGLLGKDLNELSRETVRMFYRDALAADFAF
jgi:transaldolase